MADEQPRALLLVRFWRDIVGETRRVVHLVPAPTDNTMPETLTAVLRHGDPAWTG